MIAMATALNSQKVQFTMLIEKKGAIAAPGQKKKHEEGMMMTFVTTKLCFPCSAY